MNLKPPLAGAFCKQNATIKQMTKLLNGYELVDFIKERQAKQVRNLRQSHATVPRLAIVVTAPSPVIETYMRLKQRYGEDILVEVDIHRTDMESARTTIERLNQDEAVHGIIVQLPLADPASTTEIVNLVAPEKDVDGLGEAPLFDPATPVAINWLLAGYNVDLATRKIAIVGHGRLVGQPLAAMWRSSGYDIRVFDKETADLATELKKSDIIVTATGQAALITSAMIPDGAIVVDAGTASEHGKIVGDVATDARQRDDLTITPEKGGVGPLTVAALFENVLQAARRRTQ